MPNSEIFGWILCGVSVTAFLLAKYVESRSRVDAQSYMAPKPDFNLEYPQILIGDFGQCTVVYREGYFKHFWLLDDPFDVIKELKDEPSPKLDEPQIGEPE